jgi:hypothetical protein
MDTGATRNREAIVRTLAAMYAARDADPPSVWVAGRIDDVIKRLERMLREAA